MIRCPICKRVTKKYEPTGKFTTYVYKDLKDLTKGKDIYSELVVCMNCHHSGPTGVLLK